MISLTGISIQIYNLSNSIPLSKGFNRKEAAHRGDPQAEGAENTCIDERRTPDGVLLMETLHQAAQPLQEQGDPDRGEEVDAGHARPWAFGRHPLLDMGVHDPAGAAEKTKKEKKDA
jgi:hypothetical protein